MKHLLPLLLLLSFRLSAQTVRDTTIWQNIKRRILPEQADTFIKDTVLKRTDYDTTLTSVYVIKCDTCEIQRMAAYKITRCKTEFKFATPFYTKTGKPVLDLSQLTGPGCPWNAEHYKYLRYDKKAFSTRWKILKEKEL